MSEPRTDTEAKQGQITVMVVLTDWSNFGQRSERVTRIAVSEDLKFMRPTPPGVRGLIEKNLDKLFDDARGRVLHEICGGR